MRSTKSGVPLFERGTGRGAVRVPADLVCVDPPVAAKDEGR